MVDYKILEDIPHYGQNRKDLERRYMCASLGLFYVQGSGHLLPIAIQLHQQPSDNLIWTPNDSELDWLCAKLWLRNSDAQFHQVSQWVLCRIRSHDPNSFCWMANDSEGQENKEISSIRKLISFFFFKVPLRRLPPIIKSKNFCCQFCCRFYLLAGFLFLKLILLFFFTTTLLKSTKVEPSLGHHIWWGLFNEWPFPREG